MRILVTGASGWLGAYVLDQLVSEGRQPIAWSGRDTGDRSRIPLHPIDLTDPKLLHESLSTTNPDVIIHLAAVSAAAEVHRDPQRARALNVEATCQIAMWCQANDRRLVFTSTDLVFSGAKAWNREDDPTEPILAYGRTKTEAEAAVKATPRSLVARMPLMFGPTKCGRQGFFDQAMSDLHAGKPRSFFDDEFRTPLDFGTAARILVQLALSDLTGVIHVAGAERMSRFDLMRRLAGAMRLDMSLIQANQRRDVPGAEPRPADVSLSTDKLRRIYPHLSRPTVEAAVASWQNPTELT